MSDGVSQKTKVKNLLLLGLLLLLIAALYGVSYIKFSG